MSKNRYNKPNDFSMPKKSREAISEYRKSADPLGSYTGLTTGMQNELQSFSGLPRADLKTDGGKVFLSIDSLPVQDADDL